jgi:hypothetical protein
MPRAGWSPPCKDPSSYPQASRERWAPLVLHCRTHGGDGAYEADGHSLRHGIGVGREVHAASLDSIGLRPETGADGAYVGLDPGITDPLSDPEHPFKTWYKAGAEAVLGPGLAARGRLL